MVEAPKTKLSQIVEREIKRVAGTDEDPTTARIEDVLRIEPIRVQPQSVVVVFNVEHVQIAVRIGNV